ncbi:MAG: GGDEF domain-containing protein [Treponema sp.]|nr:GGDEF domain-containing protein [Treponema sp.]
MRFSFATFFRDEKKLFLDNTLPIAIFNAKVFCFLSKVTILFLFILLAGAFFFHYGLSYVTFILTSLVCNSLFLYLFSLLRRGGKASQFILPLCYFDVTLFYMAVIFTSLYKTTGIHVGVAFTCFEILVPILILDRSWRISAVCLCSYAVHLVFCYFMKPFDVFCNDLVNTSVFCFLGMFIGGFFRFTQLINIDNDRDLLYQRDTDMLTGLPNRRVLFEFLSLSRLNLYQVLDVIMVDIDFFKKYNDTYGHQKGDACLAALGECFKKFGDSHKLTFCRYGGEEFIGIGMHYDTDELVSLADSLRQEVEALQIPFKEYDPGHITISAGCACCFIDEDLSDQIVIKIADDALYQAKRAGRNCVKY